LTNGTFASPDSPSAIAGATSQACTAIGSAAAAQIARITQLVLGDLDRRAGADGR
jgi:hypothetical protein